MKRRIFHLHILATNEHKYYGSLAAIFLDNKELGVSKFTLDRYDFSTPYENGKIVIRKGEMLSTGDARKKCEHIWVRTTKDYKPAWKCTECGEISLTKKKRHEQ